MKRLALALAAVVLTTGCRKIQEKLAEKAAEKAIETTTGDDTKISGGSVTFKDEKSGSTYQAGEGAKLPDGWPSSVPVYPGAKIESALDSDSGKTVILHSADAPSKITAFYKSNLPGMKKVGELDHENLRTISFEGKGQTVNVMVTTSSDPDQPNMIQLSVAPKS